MPVTPTEKIWMDGELVDWDKATVHVLTHSLHYGMGVLRGSAPIRPPTGRRSSVSASTPSGCSGGPGSSRWSCPLRGGDLRGRQAHGASTG